MNLTFYMFLLLLRLPLREGGERVCKLRDHFYDSSNSRSSGASKCLACAYLISCALRILRKMHYLAISGLACVAREANIECSSVFHDIFAANRTPLGER